MAQSKLDGIIFEIIKAASFEAIDKRRPKVFKDIHVKAEAAIQAYAEEYAREARIDELRELPIGEMIDQCYIAMAKYRSDRIASLTHQEEEGKV